MRTELAKLYERIDKLETAMMTTRRRDGHLVSRAMATQKHAPGADLWFVTAADSGKLPEIENDPHVGSTSTRPCSSKRTSRSRSFSSRS